MHALQFVNGEFCYYKNHKTLIQKLSIDKVIANVRNKDYRNKYVLMFYHLETRHCVNTILL